MKTSTLLILAGGGAAAYFLLKRSQAAPAVAATPAVAPATGLPIIQTIADQAAAVFDKFSDALKTPKTGTTVDVTTKYQSPPIYVPPASTLSGTCMDGHALASKNGLGSLG